MKLLRLLLLFVFLFVWALFEFSYLTNHVHLYYISLFVHGLIIWKVRRQKHLLLLALFMFFYLFYQSFIFIDGGKTAGWVGFNTPYYLQNTLRIHFLFLCFFNYFLKKKGNVSIGDLVKRKNNNAYFFVFTSLFLFSSLLGSRGGGVGGLSLFEYSVIFFLLAFKYSKGVSYYKLILGVVTLVFGFVGVSSGGRIELLQVLLLFFILILDISKISYRSFFLLLAIGFYSMILIGSIRHNPSVLLKKPSQILLAPFNQISEGGFEYNNIKYSHHGDVYYSSTRMIGLVETGELSTLQRVESMIYMFLSVGVPSRYMPANANLATYKKEKFNHGGGGLIDIYFYIYLGYFGIVLIAFWLAFIFNSVKSGVNQFFLLYVILVLSTYPRWWAYSPITMFKLCFWILPLFLICNALTSAVRKNDYLSIRNFSV